MSDPYLNCDLCGDQCACRALRDKYEALREIAKAARDHVRGDADGAKLAKLLDETGDPELMFTS